MKIRGVCFGWGEENNYLTVLQRNFYYPFGMNLDGVMPLNTSTENRFQYNGKELEKDFGIDLSDYGARWYDAAIGRFTSVDPLADKAPSWTPYRYGFDNPVLFIDPYGLFETKKEARKYRRQTKGLGWLKGDKIRKQKDGTYSIDNNNENRTISKDPEYGVLTGAIVKPYDLVETDNGHELRTPSSLKTRPLKPGEGLLMGTPPDFGMKAIGVTVALSGIIKVPKKMMGIKTVGSKSTLLSSAILMKLGLRARLGRKIPTFLGPSASHLHTALGRNAIPIGGGIYGLGYLYGKWKEKK